MTFAGALNFMYTEIVLKPRENPLSCIKLYFFIYLQKALIRVPSKYKILQTENILSHKTIP